MKVLAFLKEEGEGEGRALKLGCWKLVPGPLYGPSIDPSPG